MVARAVNFSHNHNSQFIFSTEYTQQQIIVTTISMAQDLAREIVALSGSSSKLAFSFDNEAFLYMSKDDSGKMSYNVHKRRFDDNEEYYEFTYADLDSAVQLLQALIPDQSCGNVYVRVVLYKDGIDYEEVLYLGQKSKKILTEYLQETVQLLNVTNVVVL